MNRTADTTSATTPIHFRRFLELISFDLTVALTNSHALVLSTHPHVRMQQVQLAGPPCNQSETVLFQKRIRRSQSPGRQSRRDSEKSVHQSMNHQGPRPAHASGW